VPTASDENESLLNELRTFREHLQQVVFTQPTATTDTKPVEQQRRHQSTPVINAPCKSRPVVTEQVPCIEKRRAFTVGSCA
jgi:hypothetical protein